MKKKQKTATSQQIIQKMTKKVVKIKPKSPIKKIKKMTILCKQMMRKWRNYSIMTAKNKKD